MKLLSKIVAVALGCLFLLFAAAAVLFFATTSVSTSSVSTLANGRTVTAISDGWGGLDASDTKDTTTINMAGHKIVVSPTAVMVDGRLYAPIDETVKSVTINAHKGELTFEADGAPLAPSATNSAAD